MSCGSAQELATSIAQSITTTAGPAGKTFEVTWASPRQWPCGGGAAGAAAGGRAVVADVVFAAPREQATPPTHSRVETTSAWRTIDNLFQQFLRDSSYGRHVLATCRPGCASALPRWTRTLA